ncbi:uncharacterized protein K452DRAFT_311505 [Aplosporella prunicola CBS 121167]|uniref:DNA-directed RNA polymerase III subunit RPC9 n=1 Tax=Aplosporella prunicola CBS 121167 TaxID=1176127 RepID=A0A6A6B3D9_9PEZI|nr:uncharacterized protein K452DRAFT_311505 [Aplosporella prunicola CBS 121167]KAF2138570.1 hypothetical protein K452DRAFT_311505 [Aplosporella prunicola CBS 121167]
MKILEKQSSVLSNYEVLAITRELTAEHDGSDGSARARPMPGNLKRILTDVTTHLTHPKTPTPTYTAPQIATFLTRLQRADFKLEKPEALMVLNLRPRTLAELDTVMEELDGRLDEARQEELLALVGECLGPFEEGGEGLGEKREGGTDWSV